MATDTGKSYRHGAVTGRTQFRQAGGAFKEPGRGDTGKQSTAKDRVQVKNPVTGRWIKVDTSTGRIIDEKLSEGPYKGIAIRSPGKQPKN